MSIEEPIEEGRQTLTVTGEKCYSKEREGVHCCEE